MGGGVVEVKPRGRGCLQGDVVCGPGRDRCAVGLYPRALEGQQDCLSNYTGERRKFVFRHFLVICKVYISIGSDLWTASQAGMRSTGRELK